MRRWLATEGKVGECPPDYALFQSAKYCNAKPWEMVGVDVSIWWKFKALDYLSAEGEAQEIIARRPPKK